MFYHSFPRPKQGQDSIQKGLKILESFLKSGILLVPEIITYKHKEKEYYVAQSRFCMTQTDISELKAHEKYFGGFHLEFTNYCAYSLGAMPVFYLPNTEQDKIEWLLRKLAFGYLYQLNELQTVCRYIRDINEMLIDEKDQDSIQVQGKKGADGKHQVYTVNIKQLRDILDMITQNLIPSTAIPEERRKDIGTCMDNFLGALQGIGSLLYPTNKDINREYEDLYYFRQREWRINAGISINGKQLDRELTPQEKKVLMSIDPVFFGKEITCADLKEHKRIDVCTVLPAVVYKDKTKPENEKNEPETKSKPVRELIERIIVPKTALEKARIIAKQNHFDPARVTDFVSAMEIAALESEYEAIKNQFHIQLIRSAQAWAEGM